MIRSLIHILALLGILVGSRSLYAAEPCPPEKIMNNNWCKLDTVSSSYGEEGQRYYFHVHSWNDFVLMHDSIVARGSDGVSPTHPASRHLNYVDPQREFIALGVVMNDCQSPACEVNIGTPAFDKNAMSIRIPCQIDPKPQSKGNSYQAQASVQNKLLLVISQPSLNQLRSNAGISKWSEIRQVVFDVTDPQSTYEAPAVIFSKPSP